MKYTANFMRGMVSLIMLCIVSTTFFSCSNFKKDKNGISIIYQDSDDSLAKELRLDVVSDDIIRVRLYPEKRIPAKESLIVNNETPETGASWDIAEEGGNITIFTSKLSVKVNSKSGKVSFYDKEGHLKLADAETNSVHFNPVNVEGEDFYTIQKVFNSPDDEAFYGLGQHQHGQVNYKGEDVDLYQHNIVAVVPFLISSKNYGVLWDNYSRTKFGDPREYLQINTLKLYDENKKEGGLTARYYQTRDKKEVFIERTENEICLEGLSDQHKFPENFTPATGVIEWSGYVEAKDAYGLYKFLSYSAGYLKLWVDNQLILDNWRQAWNPWSRKFKVDLQPEKMVALRIEWIPDGGESYFAFKCLSPWDTDLQNQLSLYSEVATNIDYYFINGSNADEVISGYRTLTGKAPIMPKWAMGLWQSRERYKTQEELLDVVKEYRKRKIPLDNIVLDWQYWEDDKWGTHGFDRARFPAPVEMINTLHNDLHTNIMISVWPKYYETTENYKYMNGRGWIYPENIKNRQKDWVGPGYISSFYDAFNAEARENYWQQLNDSLFSKGIDAWWLDATEPDILSNSSLEERKKLMSPIAIGKSAEYLNAYSLVHTKGIYEGQRKTAPDKRVFILTRSAFAGQQRYSSATWSGDVVSRWSDLKEQIAAGINMCASGIPYWTTDIGGFAVEKRYEYPDKTDLTEWRELNLRWFQYGTFTPLFRIHGQFPYREIFNVAPETHPVYQSMVYYDQLRYRLMPYIYTLAGQTYHDNYTIMRPLIMDHASDANVLNIKDEFMFGPNMLICPVYEYEKRSREVYLPNTSDWYDLYTGVLYEGGKTYDIDAPLSKIPVFVPQGAIIPIGPEIQYTDELPADTISLCIFSGKSGAFELYEDEGTNTNYEKGEFRKIPVVYNDKTGNLMIGKALGSYPGMTKKICFIIKLYKPHSDKSPDMFSTSGMNILYEGNSITLNINTLK